jgi:hypothetical protein
MQSRHVHNYIGGQYDYAYKHRNEYAVNQCAQRIVSTPGKPDVSLLANFRGYLGGPIGNKIARRIEQAPETMCSPAQAERQRNNPRVNT